VYPDAHSARDSSRLNWLLTTKLQENALVLRQLASSSGEDKVRITKAKMMEEIYGAIVLAFGLPPKPDESFDWTYVDKDDEFHRVKTTPLQFYEDSDFKAEEYFSLMNDPRHEYNKLYAVDRQKNSPPPIAR
jgi:bleomycin hydrolase